MTEHPDPSTRQRLIDATLNLIDELGVDAVKVTDIAERAETTTGSLYWFFKNRQALINAALAEQYVASMRSLLTSMEGSATFLQNFKVDPLEPSRVAARRRQIRVLADALESPDLALEVASIQRELLERGAQYVERVRASQSTSTDVDPYSVALYIGAMYIGFAVIDLAPGLVPDPDKWRRVNEIVLKALLTG
jgi:AcrR family transcriptional regulator